MNDAPRDRQALNRMAPAPVAKAKPRGKRFALARWFENLRLGPYATVLETNRQRLRELEGSLSRAEHEREDLLDQLERAREAERELQDAAEKLQTTVETSRSESARLRLELKALRETNAELMRQVNLGDTVDKLTSAQKQLLASVRKIANISARCTNEAKALRKAWVESAREFKIRQDDLGPDKADPPPKEPRDG